MSDHNDSPWAPRIENVETSDSNSQDNASKITNVQPEDVDLIPVAVVQENYNPQAVSPLPKSKKSHGIGRLLTVSLLCALVGGLVGGAAAYFAFATISAPKVEEVIDEITGTSPGAGLGQNTDTALSVEVAKKTLPSVVSISVNSQSGSGSGSGVVIKDDGFILTNNHVVEGSSDIEVTAGTETHKATVVGTDPTTDLAVLKVEAKDLPVVNLGSSADLEVGQYVMAVGSPFGLSKSVSVGIISGLGRSDFMQSQTTITAYINLIQTDAAINPGNSGGALVDAAGQLIGINTLIQTTSGSNAGVGFAIPVDSALNIANQLIKDGKATHPFLGVSTQTVDQTTAQYYSLPTDKGAYVVYVTKDSPADKAGLDRGDIIIKVGETDVATTEDVFTAVRSHSTGDKVIVQYYRGDKKESVEVVLGSDADVDSSQTQPPSEETAPSQMPNGGNTNQDWQQQMPKELLDMLRQFGYGN